MSFFDLMGDLFDITVELAHDIIDTCENEGADALDATSELLTEIDTMLKPIRTPTPQNILEAGESFKRTFID
jgi:hypothetical protein